MLIVKHRNTFLPENAQGAVTVYKFRHIQVGEPALNANVRMTAVDVDMFNELRRTKQTTAQDIVAGRTSTYTYMED